MADKQNHFAAFPARVIVRANPQEVLDGLDLELEEGVTPFVWSAEISSTRLDAYYTHMDESTLRNFADNARAGVSFLDSHDSYKLGFGQSLNGVVEIDNGVTRTVADFYTVPGIRFGGKHSYESTDDFIRAVRARLARDVSVGFYGGKYICDICGGNYSRYDECPHFPGFEYPVGEQGRDTIVCTVGIFDARLAEVSAVYDGATPEAMILKARDMAEAGQLEPKAADILQVRYRIILPDAYHNWRGTHLSGNPDGGNTMTDEEKLAQEMGRTRDLMAAAAVENAESLENGVRWLIEDRQRLAKENGDLQTRVDELAPLADDGRTYRADLVAEAMAEGVRALGAEFPQETYEEMLRDAPIAHIKKVRDTFKQQADKRFPGGRSTIDEDETQTEHADVNTSVPDEAYA